MESGTPLPRTIFAQLIEPLNIKRLIWYGLGAFTQYSSLFGTRGDPLGYGQRNLDTNLTMEPLVLMCLCFQDVLGQLGNNVVEHVSMVQQHLI